MALVEVVSLEDLSETRPALRGEAKNSAEFYEPKSGKLITRKRGTDSQMENEKWKKVKN